MDKWLFLKTFYKVRFREKWTSREAIEAHQAKGLQEFYAYMKQHSPYFREHGFTKDFLMDKSFMMANFDSLNTVGVEKEKAFAIAQEGEKSRDFSASYGDISVGLSSGTSGNYGIFLTSPNEQALWAGTILAKLLPKGRLLGHKIAFFLRSDNNLYKAVTSPILRLHYFDMQIAIEEHIKTLNTYQPSLLVAPASVCLQLARAKQAGVLTISPQRIFSVAEILEDRDRTIIEEAFGQRVYQIYQATEGFLGASCQEGTLHLNEDGLLIEKEWVDDQRFYPIITDFKRTSVPFYRYRLNDILQIEDRECPCGSKLLAIKKIEGRSDDIFYFESEDAGVCSIYPDFIRRCLILIPEIEEYQVTQVALDQLEIGLNYRNQAVEEAIVMNLKQLATDFHFTCPSIRFVAYQAPAKGQKLRRILQKINKKELEIYARINH
ncbi:F390 synthetase-related protein [Streptococcus caprae]|uniref:F390 synthetase-related protein n=1 Tax=Streptococcus caprae TaxID=1640501 RepID=A0ABV8CU89_9STRE